jgi:hypothetical protein
MANLVMTWLDGSREDLMAPGLTDIREEWMQLTEKTTSKWDELVHIFLRKRYIHDPQRIFSKWDDYVLVVL